MTELARDLLRWFKSNGRRDLPWQSTPPNVYHIWLSEIMLQQTQVITVIDYFNKFIACFPDLESLANAKEDEVMSNWAGLGYYSRARNLHKTARIVASIHKGVFPKKYDEIVALPGIGPSTAGAILSLGSGLSIPILDGNVKRTLSRYHKVEGHYSLSKVMAELWRLAKHHTPQTNNAEYTQAIMDIGATICKPKNPLCGNCPLAIHCGAYLSKEQDIYPHKKTKQNKAPEKTIAFLIFTNERQEVFLKKRPGKGIWGGLWSFVECDDNAEAINLAIRQHSNRAKIIRPLAKFKHNFTHFNLWINPILVYSPGGLANYYDASSLALGTPAPVKKILQEL
ncbi:A/G-specific adenine glycosylase [Candidatus Pseudothioglobus singularis]|nr:A/G-specific adenine glycosylase [Candidatus Pseudothioglobus singularis]